MIDGQKMYYKNQPDEQSVQNTRMSSSASTPNVGGAAGGANVTSAASMDDIINRNQAQIKEVTNIMQQNIQKAMDRDISLTILENNVDNLQASAGEFQISTKKTHQKYLWKNRKWTVILIAVVVTIMVIIILGLALGIGLNNNKNNNNSG